MSRSVGTAPRKRWWLRQLLFLGAAALAAAYCLWWIDVALREWSNCCSLLPLKWTPEALSIVAFVNVLGLLIFAARNQTWGWVALAIVQVGNLFFSLVGLWAHYPPPWFTWVNPIAFVVEDPPGTCNPLARSRLGLGAAQSGDRLTFRSLCSLS